MRTLSLLLGLFISTQILASPFSNLIQKAEKRYSLPEGLLDAIIKVESSYQARATNNISKRRGVVTPSYGLGQLTLATAVSHCGLTKTQLFEPVKNIFCAAKVLRHQLDRYDNILERAIAAYNSGTVCECVGEEYKMNLGRKIVRCGEERKCSEEGNLANQDYVELVTSNFFKVQ